MCWEGGNEMRESESEKGTFLGSGKNRGAHSVNLSYPLMLFIKQEHQPGRYGCHLMLTLHQVTEVHFFPSCICHLGQNGATKWLEVHSICAGDCAFHHHAHWNASSEGKNGNVVLDTVPAVDPFDLSGEVVVTLASCSLFYFYFFSGCENAGTETLYRRIFKQVEWILFIQQ